MSWMLLIVAAWLLVSVVGAVLVGRSIHLADGMSTRRTGALDPAAHTQDEVHLTLATAPSTLLHQTAEDAWSERHPAR
ncbi:hypothetical protein [Geodermatophilus ruber]|uniref:Uncharacterized protein n=1 Tax=Geodermatophilus ruber TaxID=504800 RepID=A0A1I4DHH8_9ACTN|nr:hypothetical protein [Geodermatophilus ruber]SFK92339.1 hypothetical protein SAMN04488085_104371 [Geodermatophilus ruber]